MSKRDKLIQKILKGKSEISPDEVINLLKSLGYVSTSPSGSHLTFRKKDRQSVTIVLTQNPLKPYMVAKIQDVLEIEGY